MPRCFANHRQIQDYIFIFPPNTRTAFVYEYVNLERI